MKRYTIVSTLLCFSILCFSQEEKWSDQQIELINVDCLHERGLTGKGVTIAHLDDGCDGCDKIDIFKYSHDKGYWKGSYDFIQDKALEFRRLGSHGTATLSIVHGLVEGKYTGVAYDANILMARTENVASETHQEERDWRKAVEWSIENGADIITSSLQYNEFDKGEGDYEYKDMDGQTAIITNAADYAASKGVVVVTLQGNFGNDAWYYLTAPGDADSVITVGAADKLGAKARFSGYGPTFDGRMKPDIMAMGERTAVAKPDNSIVRGNGTSYAAPAIAGLMACLKQGHPERSNMQLISAVRQSGNHYRNPSAEDGYGYGVADACVADDILNEMDKYLSNTGKWVVNDILRFKRRKNKILIKSRDRKNSIMKLVLKDVFENEMNRFLQTKSLDIGSLETGDYLIDVYLSDNTVKTIYFYKY
jgi:subtilisin family serine protease